MECVCWGALSLHLMSQQDLVECDHVRRRFKWCAFYAYYNPDHKWHYLSRQKPEEVMFLKIFDSDPLVRATNCSHTSFQHLNSPKDCPLARVSRSAH
ncbi:hypothetical protein B0T26DRAFT_784301 [Lasiosphaeria miniovina]|uniref:Uncharacterized protein n=1 Tax=Lasiosphaeria miniovina TaxID=1954250 RepID=A0AA40DWD7_9PEZI|nr:uncharacterized protein B0T26DRAFT_784301 [Lasiosphaeria miniovina]KAK0714198.1 hypothetical protein B0T26DRAFT_784301 [Lasiosphaeria miniovina]